MRAGTSEKLITPDVGIELSGYLARMQPSIGKYDELFARALYLESAGKQLVWILCDLIGFSNELAWDIRNLVAKKLSIDPLYVVLSATHTHAGPATVRLRKCGDIDPAYVDFLKKIIPDCAEDAMKNAEDVSMYFSESSVDGVSIDRTNSKYSHVDKRLPVLAFRRRDCSVKAVFSSFTIHNVGLSNNNRKISADIAGFAARKASSLIEGNPTVFLTNGPCGNINPAMMTDDYAGVEKAGNILGESIAGEMSRLEKCDDTSISSFFSELELPLEILSLGDLEKIIQKHEEYFSTAKKDWWTDRLHEAFAMWEKDTREIIENKRPLAPAVGYAHIVKLGPVTLAGINAEVFSKMADQLRELTGIQKLYVIGYTDGCIGYMAPEESFEDAGYAVNEAHKFYAYFRLKPGAFELLRDAIAFSLKH